MTASLRVPRHGIIDRILAALYTVIAPPFLGRPKYFVCAKVVDLIKIDAWQESFKGAKEGYYLKVSFEVPTQTDPLSTDYPIREAYIMVSEGFWRTKPKHIHIYYQMNRHCNEVRAHLAY